eukprot:scaffold29800_cov23-Attheya_sp.AAC.1
MQLAESVAAGEGRISKDWFNNSEDILLGAIGLRNYWHDLWIKGDIPGARAKFKEARTELHMHIGIDKTKWHEGRAKEVHDMKFNQKSAWQSIKEIRDDFEGHYTQQSNLKMRKSNGDLASSDAENADVMGEHFTKVFNNHRDIDLSVLEELDQRTTDNEVGNPPTAGEIALALRKAANGKAPGESGITAEALKALEGIPFRTLKDFLVDHWENPETDFVAWHKNTLCALAKQGKGKDHSDPNNWRGICLAEIPANTQSSIISTRLLIHLEKVGIETQYGCVPGKGCADALFAIKNALQSRRQHNTETLAIFVDLVKAFDTADHQLLFKILKKYGVPDNLVVVIEKMYRDTSVTFRTGKEKRDIPYGIGVKQGDNMAPVIFIYLMNAFAETLCKKWNFVEMEYKWFPQSKNGNKRGRLTSQSPKSKGSEIDLFYFLYVDDGAMLFDTREDLAEGTQLLFIHFARFGLKMHIGVGDKKSKTECVHFPAANQQQPANLENIQVEQGFVSFTNCFKYLGSIISSNLNDEIDIDARISQANKAMGAPRGYFRCPQVNLHSKRLIYLAIPINLVLWGVESWALTERCYKKLQVFHTRSIRSILQINMTQVEEERITNHQILKRIDIPSMENIIAKRQLKWLGKIVRMEERRLPIKMLSFRLPTPRPAHKPHTTNRNSLVRSLQILDPNISKHGILDEWFPSAQNEEEWNQRIENIFVNEKEPPRKRRRFGNVTESEHHPETNQGVHLPTP